MFLYFASSQVLLSHGERLQVTKMFTFWINSSSFYIGKAVGSWYQVTFHSTEATVEKTISGVLKRGKKPLELLEHIRLEEPRFEKLTWFNIIT